MINRIGHLNIFDSGEFSSIAKYRNLRNRVHLQMGNHKSDTDYFNFAQRDYYWTKHLLFIVLSNPKIGNDLDDLDFLVVSDEDKQKAGIAK